MGQPTANSESMLPTRVLPPCAYTALAAGGLTYVAMSAPVRTDDDAQTG